MSSGLVSIDEIIKFIRKVTSFFSGFNKNTNTRLLSLMQNIAFHCYLLPRAIHFMKSLSDSKLRCWRLTSDNHSTELFLLKFLTNFVDKIEFLVNYD